MKLIAQSLLLIASFAFIFIWQNTFFSQYTLWLFMFLSGIYIAISFKKRNFDPIKTFQNELFGLFALNTIVILIVLMSGNFSSSLFFLLYFLSFGIASAYEPSVIFVFTIGIFVLLFPYILKEDVMRNILMIGSLVTIAPIAFFFSRTLNKNKK